MRALFLLLYVISLISFANVGTIGAYLYASIAQKQTLDNLSFTDEDQKLINHYSVDLKKIANSTPLIKLYMDILEEESIPIDFAILPIIESGNNPKARSPKNAVGLWQFTPETAYEYNLSESDFNDDRTDVIKSTFAAVTYLRYLHSIFNDWELVLAAYNWGPNNVKNALNKSLYNKNGKLDLSKLPVETKKYLISFHAYNQAIKNNFHDPILNKYPDSKYISRINHDNLSNYLIQNPDITSVSPKVLEHINGFNVYNSPSKKFILVPTSIFKEFFSLNEISFKNKSVTASNKINKPLRCINYQTQYNDTFNSIAEKQSINEKALREFNPSVRFIRPNLKLNICYG